MRDNGQAIYNYRYSPKILRHWRWHFVAVPKTLQALIHNSKNKIGYGFVPIVATVGKTTWKTSLLPGKGMYFIALKAAIRKKEGISINNTVTINFEFVCLDV